ncbi:MAG TPA: hypothetical protein VFG42_15580 [Baekduia sp.]|uniref:hypothetical protein n=1 Tax=Baekduia sp. TaxID=2600305 RepID=UPI002D78D879|nr:hypothetical protein [Baekduia sp.]HET6508212.1 hypothetical protein [Baekduia sp.]
MPSPHSRVGLVVDEPMERTLDWLASRRPEDPARASVARRAVFEGAVLEAMLRELTVDGALALEAPRVVAAFLRVIDGLDLPADVLAAVRSQLDNAGAAQQRELRRARQRALLLSGAPADGPTAQDIIDSIETLDDPFA